MGGVFYSLVVYMFVEENPLLALWLTILVCAVLFAVLSMIYFDQAVIFGSAIAGSYMLMRVTT